MRKFWFHALPWKFQVGIRPQWENGNSKSVSIGGNIVYSKMNSDFSINLGESKTNYFWQMQSRKFSLLFVIYRTHLIGGCLRPDKRWSLTTDHPISRSLLTRQFLILGCLKFDTVLINSIETLHTVRSNLGFARRR